MTKAFLTALAIALAAAPALAQTQGGSTQGMNSSGSSTVGVGHPGAASGDPRAEVKGTGDNIVKPGIGGGMGGSASSHAEPNKSPATPAPR